MTRLLAYVVRILLQTEETEDADCTMKSCGCMFVARDDTVGL